MESHEAMRKMIGPNTREHARAIGRAYETVSRWQRPNGDGTDTGSQNPLDWLTSMVQTAELLGAPAASSLAPVHYLCGQFDHIAVPLPVTNVTAKELSHAMNQLAKEFGDVARAHTEALDDDKLTIEEVKRLKQETLELMSFAYSYILRAERSAEKSGGEL